MEDSESGMTEKLVYHSCRGSIREFKRKSSCRAQLDSNLYGAVAVMCFIDNQEFPMEVDNDTSAYRFRKFHRPFVGQAELQCCPYDPKRTYAYCQTLSLPRRLKANTRIRHFPGLWHLWHLPDRSLASGIGSPSSVYMSFKPMHRQVGTHHGE
jgi:hypothetical protein